MAAAISSIHESDNHGQALLDEVVQLFAELLCASGATIPMIKAAMTRSVESNLENNASTIFTDLGSLQRDCMEVMCAWRRDIELVDGNGEPMALPFCDGEKSFESLCKKAGCRHPSSEIMKVLLEFGAISKGADERLRSETPTFLVAQAASGGRLATDALLKQLQGFLSCVHGNLQSVAGVGRPRFERACTVTVAAELEPILDRLVRSRGQEFIDSIDEWLERHTKHASPSGRYVELGAGAYFVELGERSGRKWNA